MSKLNLSRLLRGTFLQINTVSSHRLNSNPFFSMKDCKTKMLHKVSGLSKAANFQYFFACLLITLPLILASFTLKRKYIKLLKIYELEIHYLNIISPVFELWDMVKTADSDLIANAFQQHKTPSAILSLLGSLKSLFSYPR